MPNDADGNGPAPGPNDGASGGGGGGGETPAPAPVPELTDEEKATKLRADEKAKALKEVSGGCTR
jgi:hypothetical protein